MTPVRILLATDAASEGIDLQRHCHRMVHYEIPWNPNRLEQRNGRIDRHGQPDARGAHLPLRAARARRPRRPGSLEADLEFLSAVARKVEQIRDDLGIGRAGAGRRRSRRRCSAAAAPSTTPQLATARTAGARRQRRPSNATCAEQIAGAARQAPDVAVRSSA